MEIKKTKQKSKKVSEPVPEPEPEVDELSEELDEAGEDFDEDDEEMYDFPEVNLTELYAHHFEHEGQNVAEILAGIRDSIDANSKCILKLIKKMDHSSEK